MALNSTKYDWPGEGYGGLFNDYDKVVIPRELTLKEKLSLNGFLIAMAIWPLTIMNEMDIPGKLVLAGLSLTVGLLPIVELVNKVKEIGNNINQNYVTSISHKIKDIKEYFKVINIDEDESFIKREDLKLDKNSILKNIKALKFDNNEMSLKSIKII